MRTSILLSLILLLAVSAAAEIKMDPVEYQHDGTPLAGFVAYDDALAGRRPGVLIVHQWMGVTDNEKMRARMLAELGYVAFVADIYGRDTRPKDRGEAGQFAGRYKNDRALLRGRLDAALAEMRKHERVDTSRIAAIGYCFGGMAALEVARSGADVRGVVSFHGSLDTATPEEAKNIRCAVLVLHGADDRNAPPETIKAFLDEMRGGGVDYELVLYGNAVHSFTQKEAGNDPSRGSAYNETADKRSWEKMKDFFREVLGGTKEEG